MKIWFGIIICFFSELHTCFCNNFSDVPDERLTTPELILKYGYPAETHEVRTSDGYILTLHRIAGPPGSKVVLLHHPLQGSSVDWVLTGPKVALGYFLFDAGYDVWMANARGNRYSRKHERFSPSDMLFWDFSWHEIGIYDLPPVIDYILGVTGQQKLNYVGHSMGCAVFLVLTSTLPEYNHKIGFMAGLAPAGFVSKTTNIVFRLGMFSKVGVEAEKSYSSEFFPNGNTKLQRSVAETVCKNASVSVCKLPVILMAAMDVPRQEDRMIPLIIANFPAGTSFKTWVHFGQLMRTGKFQQYDHGKKLNLWYYKSEEPPEYNLTAITVPVIMFASKGDTVTVYQDVERTYKSLPNRAGFFSVSPPTFNHWDFIYGVHTRDNLYSTLLQQMNKHDLVPH